MAIKIPVNHPPQLLYKLYDLYFISIAGEFEYFFRAAWFSVYQIIKY